jgi:hypothetical protein
MEITEPTLQRPNFVKNMLKIVNHPSKRKLAFSQCLHCISKFKFPAAASVLNLALFPIETQFLIKLCRETNKSDMDHDKLQGNNKS